jgi:hypothetical protein
MMVDEVIGYWCMKKVAANNLGEQIGVKTSPP